MTANITMRRRINITTMILQMQHYFMNTYLFTRPRLTAIPQKKSEETFRLRSRFSSGIADLRHRKAVPDVMQYYWCVALPP